MAHARNIVIGFLLLLLLIYIFNRRLGLRQGPLENMAPRIEDTSEKPLLDPIGLSIIDQHQRGLFKLGNITVPDPPDAKRPLKCVDICTEYGTDDPACSKCLNWADRTTPGWGISSNDEGIRRRNQLQQLDYINGSSGSKKPFPYRPMFSIGGDATTSVAQGHGIWTNTR